MSKNDNNCIKNPVRSSLFKCGDDIDVAEYNNTTENCDDMSTVMNVTPLSSVFSVNRNKTILNMHKVFDTKLDKIYKHFEIECGSDDNEDIDNIKKLLAHLQDKYNITEEDYYIYVEEDVHLLVNINNEARILISTKLCSTIDDQQYLNIRVLYSFKNVHIDYSKYMDEINTFYTNFKRLEKYANIEYYYMSDHSVSSYTFREYFKDDIIYQEAYPFIPDIDNYIDSYIAAKSPLMVFYGAAGTGKTRLIRYITKKLYEKHKIDSEDTDFDVYYTTDSSILVESCFFIDFMDVGNVLVLEDMDEAFADRLSGNAIMHKFLSSSDGFLQNTKLHSKMLFSTNLKTVKNIDSALIRPGRCFNAINFRLLTAVESVSLLNKLFEDNDIIKKINICDVKSDDINVVSIKNKEYSLAEVYEIFNNEKLNITNEISTAKKTPIGF